MALIIIEYIHNYILILLSCEPQLGHTSCFQRQLSFSQKRLSKPDIEKEKIIIMIIKIIAIPTTVVMMIIIIMLMITTMIILINILCICFFECIIYSKCSGCVGVALCTVVKFLKVAWIFSTYLLAK